MEIKAKAATVEVLYFQATLVLICGVTMGMVK